MAIQPSEFIALTQTSDTTPIRISGYNKVPGTVVRLRNHIFVLVDAQKGAHQWLHAQTGHSLSHEQLVSRMRADENNLPVTLWITTKGATSMDIHLNESTLEELRKALEDANNDTRDLTSTQFQCFTPECRRVVMDSLDIKQCTVVVVDGWEAMRVVGNEDRNEKAWIGFDGRMYTHEQFADITRNSNDVVRVVHYGII